MKSGYVYILANSHNTALYVGSTVDLKKRVYLHRNRLIAGFTKRYNVTKLVYFEVYTDEDSALTRERRLKGKSRAKKLALISAMNFDWQDLYHTLE